MKKFIIFTLVALTIFLIGCDENNVNDALEIEAEEWVALEDSKYASLLPDADTIFANGEITITDPDGGEAYIFEITNWTEDERSMYIHECVRLGFNDVSYDTDESFGAYSEDGNYWVSVMVDEEILYILCQLAKKT